MFLIRNISKEEIMRTYLHIFSFLTGILKELAIALNVHFWRQKQGYLAGLYLFSSALSEQRANTIYFVFGDSTLWNINPLPILFIC